MSRMADYCDLACDVCNLWVPGVVSGTAEMRKILKEEGWTLRKGQRGLEDVCPACNKRDKEYWFKRRHS